MTNQRPHHLTPISQFEWEIKPTGPMRVPVRIFGSEKLVTQLEETVIWQISNVATLPGIQKYAIAMPDAHSGYGFPIGGIAAFDPQQGGVISMGGIGFDISCGVRTMTTGLSQDEVQPHLEKLVDRLYADVPAGLGVPGKIKTGFPTLDQIMIQGAHWAVKNGYGTKQDLERIEDGGRVEGADPTTVSEKAKKRQRNKMGTLGSGNHYVEVQVIDQIYDAATADRWDLREGDVVISFHCGSRALGHQIGTDYLRTLAKAVQKYRIKIPDRELVCAPINSPEGKQFLAAVRAGINCALANRQILAHLVRQAVITVFPGTEVATLYDVSHNTAKFEEYEGRQLLVHRKGATRAFKNQPALVGGSMGTASFILVGTGDPRSFASCVHGAGRIMSRTQARKSYRGLDIVQELEKRGTLVRSQSTPGIAEEAPSAYKDVEEVVDVVDKLGFAKKVARLKPLGCVKG
ncbi:RtcB family protein [Candidatus Parcubacteria bacterium]|nr:RtcB family protein [Candidatus Parcubacteria bacterium]